MNRFLYSIVALVLIGLAVALGRRLARRFDVGLLGALVVALGLVYDNGVLALGTTIGEGPTLLALNWPRYWIHALATPLLILFAASAATRGGLGGTRTSWFRAAAWGLTGAMIAYGVFVEVPSALEPRDAGGILRYEAAGGSSVPIPAIVTNVALIVAGVALWNARGWAWLGAASVAALMGFALGPVGAPEVVGQVAEVVLVGGIVATERWLQRREPTSG